MKRLFAVLFCFLCATRIAHAQENEVPSWFQGDAAKPYKVFYAWKSLSTREATLYQDGAPMEVLGGQLRDEQGKPVPNAWLNVSFHDSIRGYDYHLATDAKGYFVVFSPHSLNVMFTTQEIEDKQVERFRANYGGIGFTAAVGYPHSSEGWRYAQAQGAVQLCRAREILREKGRAFYILTLDKSGNPFKPTLSGKAQPFSAREFALWKKAEAEERKKQRELIVSRSELYLPTDTQIDEKHRKRLEEEKATPGIRVEPDTKVTYRVRVLSPERKAVAGALVGFWSVSGDTVSPAQTDAEGRARLSEYIILGRDTAYYASARLQRQRMTVAAKGYASGPIDFPLDAGKENVIVLKKPAAVSGKLIDEKGNPIQGEVKLNYRKSYGISARNNTEENATFSFDNVMPNEPFKLRWDGNFSHQITPRAPAETPWMILQSQQSRRDIILKIPQAAAVRGIVVDETGKVPSEIQSVTLQQDNGESWSQDNLYNPWLKSTGEFGFSRLGQQRFRMLAKAEGKRDYASDWIKLEPGEMRFFEIVMKPQAPTQIQP